MFFEASILFKGDRVEPKFCQLAVTLYMKELKKMKL